MPFKNDSQRRWMFANKPALARKWQREYMNNGGRVSCNTEAEMLIEQYKYEGGRVTLPHGYTISVINKMIKDGVTEAPADMTKNERSRFYERLSIVKDGLISHVKDVGLTALGGGWDAIRGVNTGPIKSAADAKLRLMEAGIDVKNIELFGEFALDPLTLIALPAKAVITAARIIKTIDNAGGQKKYLRAWLDDLGKTEIPLSDAKSVGARVAKPLPSLFIRNADGTVQDLSGKMSWEQFVQDYGASAVSRKNKKGPLPQDARWSFSNDFKELPKEVKFNTEVPAFKQPGDKAVRLPQSLDEATKKAVRKDIDDVVGNNYETKIQKIADEHVGPDDYFDTYDGLQYETEYYSDLADGFVTTMKYDNKANAVIAKKYADSIWPQLEKTLEKYKELGAEKYNAIRKFARQQSSYLFSYVREGKIQKIDKNGMVVFKDPDVTINAGILERKAIRDGKHIDYNESRSKQRTYLRRKTKSNKVLNELAEEATESAELPQEAIDNFRKYNPVNRLPYYDPWTDFLARKFPHEFDGIHKPDLAVFGEGYKDALESSLVSDVKGVIGRHKSHPDFGKPYELRKPNPNIVQVPIQRKPLSLKGGPPVGTNATNRTKPMVTVSRNPEKLKAMQAELDRIARETEGGN